MTFLLKSHALLVILELIQIVWIIRKLNNLKAPPSPNYLK